LHFGRSREILLAWSSIDIPPDDLNFEQRIHFDTPTARRELAYCIGADLLDWLTAAGAIDAKAAKLFRTQGNGLRTLDIVAQQTRSSRERFRGFVQRYTGKPLSAAVLPDLKPLNQLIAHDAIYGQRASG
jgi:hypothetical protein